MVSIDILKVQFIPDSKARGPTWGPSGADRTQVGPMLAPRTLLSGMLCFVIQGASASCFHVNATT